LQQQIYFHNLTPEQYEEVQRENKLRNKRMFIGLGILWGVSGIVYGVYVVAFVWKPFG